MNYDHKFGQFYQSISVPGKTYRFEDYQKLGSRADRQLVQEEAQRLTRERSEKVSKLAQRRQKEIREKYKPLFEKLEAKGKGKGSRTPEGRRARSQARTEIHRLRQLQQNELVAVWDEIDPEGTARITYPGRVYDMFQVWESRVESPLEKFDRLTADFDWWYEYSDDYRVWSAGDRRFQEIRALKEQLSGTSDGANAEELWQERCPYERKSP